MGEQSSGAFIAGERKVEMVEKEVAAGRSILIQQEIEIEQAGTAWFRGAGRLADDLVEAGIGAEGEGVVVESRLQVFARERQIMEGKGAEPLMIPQRGVAGVEGFGFGEEFEAALPFTGGVGGETEVERFGEPAGGGGSERG